MHTAPEIFENLGAISVAEFCDKFSMSKPTFYREVADGKIHPVKMRGKTVIPVNEVKRWWNEISQGRV